MKSKELNALAHDLGLCEIVLPLYVGKSPRILREPEYRDLRKLRKAVAKRPVKADKAVERLEKLRIEMTTRGHSSGWVPGVAIASIAIALAAFGLSGADMPDSVLQWTSLGMVVAVVTILALSSLLRKAEAAAVAWLYVIDRVLIEARGTRHEARRTTPTVMRQGKGGSRTPLGWPHR